MVPAKVLRAAMVALAVALGALPAASGAAASPRPLIVSGVSEWAAVARAVAGDGARVVSLITDPNADPHDHEATTGDAERVAEASIVIVNGAGYDTWLSKLVAARSRPPIVIDVASLAGVADGSNPHLFYSVAIARRVVAALARDLPRVGAGGGTRARAASMDAALARLAARLIAIRRACAGVPVAATEDVTGYLLAEAGLRVVTPEGLRLAVGNGVDPSIHDLALALVQLARHPAFLVDNVQTATPLTQELVGQATSHRVPVIRVTETMVGRHYAAWIGRTVGRVEADLRREGCLA